MPLRLYFSAVTMLLVSLAHAQHSPRVAANLDELDPLSAGDPLPTLAAQNLDGKRIIVNEAVERQPALLLYFRGDWCPWCNRYLGRIRKAAPELARLGYRIIAISPAEPASLKKDSSEKSDVSFTLLSDPSMAGARALGIAYRPGEADIREYLAYGIDFEAEWNREGGIAPAHAAFLVGTDEIVDYAFVSRDYDAAIDVEALLSAARREAADRPDRD